MFTITQGWREYRNGNKFNIDLRNKFFKSGYVRFEGVTVVKFDTEYNTISNENTGSFGGGTFSGSTGVPSIPSGWDVVRYVGATSVWASVGDFGEPCTAKVQMAGRSERSRSTDSLMGTASPFGIADQTVSRPSGSTRHEIVRPAGQPANYRIGTIVELERSKTWEEYSVNPSIGVASYMGELKQGQRSAQINIASLTDEQINELTVSVGGSGRVSVYIHIEYGTLPVLDTLEPVNVGSEGAILVGYLDSDGDSDATCFFRWREVGGAWSSPIDMGVQSTLSLFEHGISGLTVNEDYEYQAYATNTHGTSYGSIRSFKTEATLPEVVTLSPISKGYFDATLHGELKDTGGLDPGANVECWFEYRQTGAWLETAKQNLEERNLFSAFVDGLNYETKYEYRAVAENAVGVHKGDTVEFTTPYPLIHPPVSLTPLSGTRVEDVQPTFNFEFVEKTENPATKYHARVRLSLSSGMVPLVYEMESKDSQTGWEAYIDNEWVAFPSVGVDPGTPIRVTVQNELPFGPVYWDCAAWDGDRYGFDSSNRVDIYIPFEGIYGIYIGHPDSPTVQEEWTVLDQLDVIEASNGEIGSIDFNVHNILVTPLNLLTANESAVNGTVSDYEDVFDSLSIIDTDSYKGVQCLELTAAYSFNLYRAAFRLHYGSPVVGEVYTISGYFKKTNPDNSIGVRFFLRHQQDDGGGSYINVKTDIGAAWSEPDSNGWSRVWFTSSPIEDDVDRIELEYYFSSRYYFNPVYADALQFEKNDLPSTWELGHGADMTPYPAARNIPYGAPVLLACRDQHGQIEEFQGWVREKNPHGEIMNIEAILTEGFMAERDVGKSYSSQDIGLTVQDMVATYCAPITTDTFVDIETGYVAPIESDGKKVLSVMESIRRQYGMHYYVDRLNRLHFYKPENIILPKNLISLDRGVIE